MCAIWVHPFHTKMNKAAVCLKVIVILLISKNRLFLASHLDDKHRCGYFINIPGSALFDYVMSAYYVGSSLVCGHLCLKNTRCLSFNFGTIPRDTRFLCELSSSDTYGGPQLSRQKLIPRGKRKLLTAKENYPRQKEKTHGKKKNLAAKTKTSRQKEKDPRQKEKPRGKKKKTRGKKKRLTEKRKTDSLIISKS